jgi:hypothetical protein
MDGLRVEARELHRALRPKRRSMPWQTAVLMTQKRSWIRRAKATRTRDVILDPWSIAEKITTAEAESIAEELMIGGAIITFKKQADYFVPDHSLALFTPPQSALTSPHAPAAIFKLFERNKARRLGEQSASENSDDAQQKNRQKTAERHQVIWILGLHRHPLSISFRYSQFTSFLVQLCKFSKNFAHR